MEEEIKKLNASYEKLRIEYDELAKKNNVVLVNNKQLEDQLREEKFLTQEAEEVMQHNVGNFIEPFSSPPPLSLSLSR